MLGLRSLHKSLPSSIRTLLDAMYPRTCRICDLLLPGHESNERLSHWVCGGCEAKLVKVEPPLCEICGEPFVGAATDAFRCTNCEGRRFSFEFAISGYQAEEEVRELIHRFKYGRELALRAPLAKMLESSLKDSRLAGVDLTQWILVPVPLHRLREREREFNQCRELCRELARRTGIRTMDAMKRQRPTDAQAQLTRAQRLANLRGAFGLKWWFARSKSPLRGAKILLVDDVFTTGATTNECARTLKREGGVEKVVVISVARG